MAGSNFGISRFKNPRSAGGVRSQARTAIGRRLDAASKTGNFIAKARPAAPSQSS